MGLFLMPHPLVVRDTWDIAVLKCQDLSYNVSAQCRGCAGVLPKGVQFGGFGCQFACSGAGAVPEMIERGDIHA